MLNKYCLNKIPRCADPLPLTLGLADVVFLIKGDWLHLLAEIAQGVSFGANVLQRYAVTCS